MSPRPFRRFQVGKTLPNQTPERGLDMIWRAAEPVIELQVAKSGIDIVLDQEIDDQPTGPNAFWLTGGANELLAGFRHLIKPFGGDFPFGSLRALATGFGLLGNREIGRQKQRRYACCDREPTHPGETHGCFNCWAAISRLIPLDADRFRPALRLAAALLSPALLAISPALHA